MNVKLLRKIQKHILAEPRRLVMSIIERRGNPNTLIPVEPDEYSNYNQYEKRQKFADCGTAACIMGWARLLASHYNGHDDSLDIEFGKLCSARTWPTKFAKAYAKAKTARSRARIAANRIEHFIKTRGKE